MPPHIQKRWNKNHRRMSAYIETPGATFDDRKWYSLIDEMEKIVDDWVNFPVNCQLS